MSNLIYQTHSNGANSRTTQTTGDVTKYRFLAFNINYSTKQGVNHRDCISASCFYCFRHCNNISYIRRKFGDYHFRSISFYCTYNFSSSFGTSAENDAAFFYVGARDVDFNSIYTVNVQFFSNFAVFFRRMTVNINDYRYIIFTQFRQSFFQEIFATGVFQTDAVKHTGRSFHSALTFITSCRQQGSAFYGNSANFFKVKEIGEL